MKILTHQSNNNCNLSLPVNNQCQVYTHTHARIRTHTQKLIFIVYDVLFFQYCNNYWQDSGYTSFISYSKSDRLKVKKYRLISM